MVKVPSNLYFNNEHWTYQELPLEHCEGLERSCENTNCEWVWMTTQYENPRSNWRYLCPECTKWCLDYWNEMWRDYWADQGFYMSKPLPTEHVDELFGNNMD